MTRSGKAVRNMTSLFITAIQTLTGIQNEKVQRTPAQIRCTTVGTADSGMVTFWLRPDFLPARRNVDDATIQLYRGLEKPQNVKVVMFSDYFSVQH
jgi:hypothetical protein